MKLKKQHIFLVKLKAFVLVLMSEGKMNIPGMDWYYVNYVSLVQLLLLLPVIMVSFSFFFLNIIFLTMKESRLSEISGVLIDIVRL